MGAGMAVLAWSPLGGGMLAKQSGPAGKTLAAQAKRYGVAPAAAALSWLMVHPARPVPIVGSRDCARIRAAADAFTVEWTRAEWYAVLETVRGAKLP